MDWLTTRGLSTIGVALAIAGCSNDETSASAGAGGAGGAGGSTAAVMPTVCDYPTPAMGVGVEVGQVLPPMLSWTGFTPASASAEEVPISALHDCDGTHGIHALLLSTLQPETQASGNHVGALRDSLPAWSELGIAVVFLLLNNPDGSEVTVDGAAGWRQSFMVEEHAWVLADEDFLLVSGGQVNTPQNTLVDPRTMQVTAIDEGHPYDTTALEALAETNRP